MANHVRQQIREALSTLLTGLATSSSRVFQSRLDLLQESELPALLISTNAEKINQQSFSVNAVLERTLSINVIAVARATSNVDDTLDTMIKEVEQAINASATANTLNGLVKDIALSEIEVAMSADSDTPTGNAIMTFIASYYTQAATPDVSI